MVMPQDLVDELIRRRWKFIWGKRPDDNVWHLRADQSGKHVLTYCIKEMELARNSRWPDIENICEKCIEMMFAALAADRLVGEIKEKK